MDNSPPKPNTLAISWFFGEHQKETLILQPQYQRNPIWSRGQQCFLIDSIISGNPIPQVYLNIKTTGQGTKKLTRYEVVDGQQRLRSIIEFISGEWVLIPTIQKAYPVSKLYKKYIGKKYSELPNKIQNSIWDYPITVQELRGWGDIEIKAMFRRLNYVNERLNKQELRHSQYFGEFNEAVEKLSKHPFWDEISLFTRKDSQRMKDVEFISELFILVIDGIQEQQTTLDEFYAKYDASFPRKSNYLAEFSKAIASLNTIKQTLKETRFHKKMDFYGLFSAVVHLNSTKGKSINLSGCSKELKKIDTALAGSRARLKGIYRDYNATVIEGGTKLRKREERRKLLLKVIEG